MPQDPWLRERGVLLFIALQLEIDKKPDLERKRG